MSMNLNAEIEALKQMTVHELQDRYIDVFGERTRSNHMQYLIKRIAWRMQAQHEGDLSTRARRRAVHQQGRHPPRICSAVRDECQSIPDRVQHKGGITMPEQKKTTDQQKERQQQEQRQREQEQKKLQRQDQKKQEQRR